MQRVHETKQRTEASERARKRGILLEVLLQATARFWGLRFRVKEGRPEGLTFLPRNIRTAIEYMLVYISKC